MSIYICFKNSTIVFKDFYMPGMYGTPSPLTFSLTSLKVEQAVIGANNIIISNNIFLSISIL